MIANLDGLLVVAAVAALRLAELVYAGRCAKALRQAGATFVRDDGYALIVVSQVAWLAALAATTWWMPSPGMAWWLVGLGIFACGFSLRYASMWALGSRWHTRVYVTGTPLVSRGVYRFLPHPIYLGVSLEWIGLVIAVGAWWAILLAPLQAIALLRRIGKEERALGLVGSSKP